MPQLRIVILGLSVTSSWGNGHATNYRGLMRALSARGHEVLFLERDAPWYAENRDMPRPPWGRTEIYRSVADLLQRFARQVREADAVIVGSYVPDGTAVGGWVADTARGARAFYDIDTPVTIAALERGDCEYLAASLVPSFDLYLSFTGGPALSRLEREFGSPRAVPFYCLVDPALYFPDPNLEPDVDLGYLGTYSADRQPALDRLLLEPARRWLHGRFAVAGPQYPRLVEWPPNVRRAEHLAPRDHRGFYTAQRFTLNVTRREMIRAGHSPSVRLFEAAACATPIISDRWPGIGEFFEPGSEILLADGPDEVLAFLKGIPDAERTEIGRRARERVLREHTAEHRAAELEACIGEVLAARPRRARAGAAAAGARS